MTKPTLFTWGTPNGLKPLLMLEELEIPYEIVKVDIGKDEQKTPAFLSRNSNGRIPVLDTTIDGARTSMAESAAILVHLAEVHGRFLAPSGIARVSTLQWSFFQMGSVGPMFGQAGHFLRASEKIPYAISRYVEETKRIYGVLDQRLAESPHLGGEEYSIADMLTLFWARRPDYFGLSLDEWPSVKRWVRALEERPAVQRTLAITFP